MASMEKENVEFFTFGDLCSCFDEWSAYGAGVPINVAGAEEETITQYYVPYLSGIQISNVLLLRNNLNLIADVAEVSQEKLLSLVAESLIDSNNNVNN